MNTAELIQQISAKDVNVENFVHMVVEDARTRDEIIHLMVTNPDIMVYYHCYYVVSKASLERPDLFYSYWPEIAALLDHKNSYNRDIAMTIIANLTRVDLEDRFDQIFTEYFAHIHDVRFMTGLCCVRNSLTILKNKPELRGQIIALLLDVDALCTYPDKQKELLKADILEVFDGIYHELNDRKDMDKFIKGCITSISPKTKSRAKELVVKYGL